MDGKDCSPKEIQMHEETKAHLAALRARQGRTSKSSSELKEGVLGDYDSIFDELLMALSANYDPFGAKLATEDLYNVQAALWIEGLKGLTRTQIKHGMRNFKGQFRPTPDTFRAWCGEKAETHKSAAYSPFDKTKAIEKKGDPEVARQKLSEIKEMLRK